jgi:UDP-N-acetylmuramoyl-tripeptide--D-alanyl-D-alanine ligase
VFRVEEVARIVGGELVGSGEAVPEGCAADSRRVARGSLFFALPGARADGHAFLSDAFLRGACAAVVSQHSKPPAGRGLVVVRDVGSALRALAEAWRATFSIPIVAVTGSNGKTTTKALVAHLAGGTFRTYAAPENYNTEIGLPLALLGVPSDAELGVFELGADRPGDIMPLAELLRPTAAILTSIGPSHLEQFRTTAAVAEEKWNLVRALPAGARAFVNADSAELRALADAAVSRSILAAGLEHGAVRARLLDAVPRLTLAVDEPPLSLKTTLVGEQNGTNLLLATLCAASLGVPPPTLEERARTFRSVPHRMEVKAARFGSLIDDTYNANPSSMAAALRVVARFGDRRANRAVVFGDMLGLGERSEELHRDIARLALALPVGIIYPVGELASAALEAENDARVRLLQRGAIAADLVAQWEGQGDAAVLVKGSRGVRLEDIVAEILRLAPYGS